MIYDVFFIVRIICLFIPIFIFLRCVLHIYHLWQSIKISEYSKGYLTKSDYQDEIINQLKCCANCKYYSYSIRSPEDVCNKWEMKNTNGESNGTR